MIDLDRYFLEMVTNFVPRTRTRISQGVASVRSQKRGCIWNMKTMLPKYWTKS